MIQEQDETRKLFFYIKWLIFILICATIYLNYTGILEPAVKFLDSPELTFKAGKIEFSLYEIIISIMALVGTIWAADVISDFGENRIQSFKGITKANKALIAKFWQIIVYILALFIGLSLVGMDVGTLAVFGGALGIGIGFGLQKITSNFISGLILLFEKSIVTDDIIELKDGTSGTVKHIHARFTLLQMGEGKEVLIPNEELVINKVINVTYSQKKGRLEVKLPLSYDTDVQKAMKLMLEAAAEYPKTLKEPTPNCYIRELTNDGVMVFLYFWVEDVREGRMYPLSEVMSNIVKKFKKADIVIGSAQKVVNVKDKN
jgi:small-conductance mechanosensitive channel